MLITIGMHRDPIWCPSPGCREPANNRGLSSVLPAVPVLAWPAAYDILPAGHRGRTAVAEWGKRRSLYHAAGSGAKWRWLRLRDESPG